MNISGAYVLYVVDGDIGDVIQGMGQMGFPSDFSEADIKNMFSAEIIIESEVRNDTESMTESIFWRITKHELKGYNETLNEDNNTCATDIKDTNCLRSFIYNGEEIRGCIHKDQDKLWCATKGIIASKIY